MAIKGRSYLKTSWAFEERPVASSKLNTWDDRIESALELAYLLLSRAWGGGDGVIRNDAADGLEVAATATPGLSVEVAPGHAFISGSPYRLSAAVETVGVVAPTTNPRIDLVQARLENWDISVVVGTEDVAPVAPSPDADCVALAELHLRPGMSVIKNADDATNGYIVDVRSFV